MTQVDFRLDRLELTPQELGRHEKKVRRGFFGQAGAFIVKTAKRLLRKARKVRPSELPDEEREEYREDLAEHRAGLRPKPKLPDIISSPGNPPLLHQTNSPLRRQIRFAMSKDVRSMVAGPKRARSGIAGDLENARGLVKHRRPYISTAVDRARPRLPSMLERSIQKN